MAATTLLAGMIGYHLNGTLGMCIGGAIGWALAAVVVSAMHSELHDRLRRLIGVAEDIRTATEAVRLRVDHMESKSRTDY